MEAGRETDRLVRTERQGDRQAGQNRETGKQQAGQKRRQGVRLARTGHQARGQRGTEAGWERGRK